MARDRFAVPATGAGVERTFSKSGRIAAWTCAQKAERKRERKKNPKPTEEGQSESEDDEEEERELIKWELEWWRKEGAGIIT
jgi:hypothetical protein